MWWTAGFWIFVSTLGVVVSVYWRYMREFWKRQKVPHTQPRFPVGDLGKKGWSKNVGLHLKDLYEEFPAERFFGFWMFTNPLLMVKDLDLVRTIFVKDFNFFQDRKVYFNEKDDPLSAHLFAIEGLKWRNLRIKLSPTFTSGKMKMMFPLVVECSEEMKKVLQGPADRGEEVEVKDLIARLMTDIISLCAFGIRTNSLRNPDSKFREMGRRAIQPSLRNFIVLLLQFCMPKMGELLRLRVFPKDVSNYFLEAVRDVMESRKKQGIMRNDFMQLLIQLKDEGFVKDAENQTQNGVGEKLTFEEAAAEAFLFFLAGFETSSSTTQFALYELAKNPEIQEKLRKEILRSLAVHGNQLTYEGTREIPYLDQVIDETLRKYPVVPTLQRECNTDYRIPDSDAVIPKGTVVHVPVYAIQMDEKYFPEPEEFRPERFSEEEKHKRHNYAYLPFGEGPRNCIGKRFGQMQVRVALIVLLQNFKFELTEELKAPITFDPTSFVLAVKGGIYLKITRV